VGSSKLIAVYSKKSLHSCKDCGFFCEGEWEEQSQQPKHDLVDHYGVIGRDDLINLINFVGKIERSCLIGLKLIGINGHVKRSGLVDFIGVIKLV
jgi:hypothetical protein